MANWNASLDLSDQEIDAAVAEMVSACRQASAVASAPRIVNEPLEIAIDSSTSAGAKRILDTPPPTLMNADSYQSTLQVTPD